MDYPWSLWGVRIASQQPLLWISLTIREISHFHRQIAIHCQIFALVSASEEAQHIFQTNHSPPFFLICEPNQVGYHNPRWRVTVGAGGYTLILIRRDFLCYIGWTKIVGKLICVSSETETLTSIVSSRWYMQQVWSMIPCAYYLLSIDDFTLLTTLLLTLLRYLQLKIYSVKYKYYSIPFILVRSMSMAFCHERWVILIADLRLLNSWNRNIILGCAWCFSYTV